MSWWQITLAVILALVLVVVIVGFCLPSQVVVVRSGVIDAPPEKVYQAVATLKGWDTWSAWNTKADPTLKYTYEGPETGKGAIMRWTSEKTGNGSLEITSGDPAGGIEYDLKMEGSSLGTGAVKVEPEGTGAKTTWTFTCNFGSDLMGRYFAAIFNFDAMLGGDFEKCMAGLREHVEPKEAPAPMEPAAP